MSWRDDVLQIAGRIVKYARYTGNRRSAPPAKILNQWIGAGYVEGPDPDSDLGEKKQNQPARLMQWFGFRSAPPTQGSEAVVCTGRGGAANALVVAVDNLQHGPLDLKDGESAMYNTIAGTVIKLDLDGQISLLTPGGAKVKLKSDGSVVLTAAAGSATLAGNKLAIDYMVEAQHFHGAGTQPVAAPGAGLGGGGSATVVSGSDTAFWLRLVPGTSPAPTPGLVATVTLNKAFAAQARGFSVQLMSPEQSIAKGGPYGFYVLPVPTPPATGPTAQLEIYWSTPQSAPSSLIDLSIIAIQ